MIRILIIIIILAEDIKAPTTTTGMDDGLLILQVAVIFIGLLINLRVMKELVFYIYVEVE